MGILCISKLENIKDIVWKSIMMLRYDKPTIETKYEKKVKKHDGYVGSLIGEIMLRINNS